MRPEIIELISKLCNLYYNGIFEDFMLLKGGSRGMSIKAYSTEELINAVANNYYDEFVVRLPGKLRYEKPIYLHQVKSFRINRKSLVIDRFPLNNGAECIQQPSIRIKW